MLVYIALVFDRHLEHTETLLLSAADHAAMAPTVTQCQICNIGFIRPRVLLFLNTSIVRKVLIESQRRRIDPRVQDVARRCFKGAAIINLSSYAATCWLPEGCGMADNPKLWMGAAGGSRWGKHQDACAHGCRNPRKRRRRILMSHCACGSTRAVCSTWPRPAENAAPILTAGMKY